MEGNDDERSFYFYDNIYLAQEKCYEMPYKLLILSSSPRFIFSYLKSKLVIFGV
jgi:hypothetical protein